MNIFLSTTEYNGIAALTDAVGTSGLSWIEFMELYGVVVRPSDLQANEQNQNPFVLYISIPASEWSTTIPLITAGIAIGGPNVVFYTILAYLFGANIANDETSAKDIPFQFFPQLTYEVAEPINQDVNFFAVFQNMRPSTAATFALYTIAGDLINTQSVTTDANGTAVVTFNTGVLSGGTTEILAKVTQQVADFGTGMRAAITSVTPIYLAVA